MHHDEVADALVLRSHPPVVFGGQLRREVAIRKAFDQSPHPIHDQLDAGGLERLHEPGRQAQRNAIAHPRLAAAAGGEAQLPRFAERWRIQAVEQHARGLLVAHEAAAIDVSVAGAVLERDAPLPAGGLGGRHRVRREPARARAGHRERAVALQQVAPVLVAGMQRTFDEQAAKARAVDEQVAIDAAAIGQLQRGDEAVGRPQLDVDHGAFEALRAELQRVVAQVGGIQAGIEVIRIRIPVRRRGRVALRRHEPVGTRHHRGRGPILVRRHASSARKTQPVHERRTVVDGWPEVAEAVEETVAKLAPVAELDAQLEAGLRAAHEVGFVDSQRLVVGANGRQRGLADADGADVRRLDDDDLAGRRGTVPQLARQRCRGHPARRSAAENDDLAHGLVAHGFPCDSR